MAWNSASFESILAMIVAALFVVAGAINLAGRGAVRSDFARWGYPVWFRWLCGALELLGAALLFGQQTRVLGLVLASAIMIGALFTLLRNREPFAHLAPALVFSALVAATVALRG
ncbi:MULTISPECIES: DoxX family protein [Paraburkholderia]|uniref:DoxX family protein n=1 Tax=Paraburkholderia TaxID=1822464 RepID=UPI002255ADA0|nr:MULTISPECIES: DoxX family protein [Paraburkholderia]MCX4160186.1 DoxX family protein [Paraburkholderia megapolitana]MDN7155685.1 DoxX family protein [Paraburkholderia sp. CHISQ3]MDQ6492729.1 DoxX family protein [Paraburkholderia megapolitana]